jgi:hypothetical protein
MNSENIKKVTNQAIEQLITALNESRCETLTRYLRAIGRFPPEKEREAVSASSVVEDPLFRLANGTKRLYSFVRGFLTKL